MLERALDAAVPAAWLTADEVYGGDRRLRLWLEGRRQPFVLAIKRTELLWAGTEDGPRELGAADIAAAVAPTAWTPLSAGDGSKGPRRYDWTRVAIRPLRERDGEQWLLVRRSLRDPEEVAYYVCFAPAGTSLAALVRVAGTRWAIETCIEEAKGDVGLDQYEVRKWDGWYRHMTLALFAHAMLTVLRAQANKKGGAATAI